MLYVVVYYQRSRERTEKKFWMIIISVFSHHCVELRKKIRMHHHPTNMYPQDPTAFLTALTLFRPSLLVLTFVLERKKMVSLIDIYLFSVLPKQLGTQLLMEVVPILFYFRFPVKASRRIILSNNMRLDYDVTLRKF